MIYLVYILVCLFACTIGTLCGMGGGIIIKPVLDSTGVMSVATITFLSGCTVIAMTIWSVTKSLLKKESSIDLKNTTILAVSSGIGGLIGKQLFNLVAHCFADKDMAGGVQASLLLAATLATFIYYIKKDKLVPKKTESFIAMSMIGLILGVLGAFLGIGGGPFNVAVLSYFFSMDTKKAAANSLYIVLFCQATSTLKTTITSGIPPFDVKILLVMILFAIIGSEIGRKINRYLNERRASLMLEGVMILIMGINVYNIYKFLG